MTPSSSGKKKYVLPYTAIILGAVLPAGQSISWLLHTDEKLYSSGGHAVKGHAKDEDHKKRLLDQARSVDDDGILGCEHGPSSKRMNGHHHHT